MNDAPENGGRISPSPKWYVIFSGEPKRKHLIDYISPKAFMHVAAFCFDPVGERWIVYDVNRGGVAVVALHPREFDEWVFYMRANGARILSVDWKPVVRLPVQFGMWCVVAVRYAIGSRSLALRPIGLFRDLIREGAVEVFK